MKFNIWFATAESSLGTILIASSQHGVCSIMLGDDPDNLARELQNRFPESSLINDNIKLKKLVKQVIDYIDQPTTGFNQALDIHGTKFQQRVWQELGDIPVGNTASYSEIAKRIGSPTSARAVARACAANNIAIAIPCHRVVKNDGSLSGYRWGVERKRALLLKEAQAGQ